MCTSFGDASVSLCGALASVACHLPTAEADSSELMPFVACRLTSIHGVFNYPMLASDLILAYFLGFFAEINS